MSTKAKAKRLFGDVRASMIILCLVFIALVAPLLAKLTKMERGQEIKQGSVSLAASKGEVEIPIKIEEQEPVQILKQLAAKEAVFPEIQRWRDRFVVSETFRHRVMVFDASTHQLIKEFGKVGSGELEFHYPRAARTGREGNLYILESGNKRVQVISPQHASLAIIPLDYSAIGLAVDSDGDIYLNQPQRGEIISVFKHNGKLVRSFGRLKQASDIFGAEYKQYNDSHRLALNLALLDSDHKGHVYLAFMHLPILQKYRNDGTLVWEKLLKGPGIEWLKAALWNPPKEPGLLKFNVFRATLVMVIKGISYDPVRDLVAILLGDDTVWVLNKEGDILKVIEVPGYNKRNQNRKHNKAFWKLNMYDGTIYWSLINSEFLALKAIP